MTTVKMVQLTNHLWQITNESGKIIQHDITAHSEYEADQFIRRWISSFQGWTYILVLR